MLRVYHHTDRSTSLTGLTCTGPGDGCTFCNANNVCECQVAALGNSDFQCCTVANPGAYGEGGCNSSCKSMHFHPSIASPFLLPL